MGLAVMSQVLIAYTGPNKKTASAGKKPENESAADQQGCLIKGKPDLCQEMDRDERGWEMSNWSNGGVFNCLWNPQNISFGNGIMTIKLTKDGGSYPYDSGEYRTSAEKVSYGYYEARMKTAKGAGLVAGTFFTCTVDGSHDEVDVEVLGKNTTQVQFNYFSAGKGGHEELIDLGFDASKGFHNYGFVWKNDSIQWFIDGKLVCTATKDIPSKPGRITVNFWPGTSALLFWLGGVYNGKGGQVQVQYDWIKYKSLR